MTLRSEMHYLFTGSFDPFTLGHADIVERTLRIPGATLTIGVGFNIAKAGSRDSAESRRRHIAALYKGNPAVSVTIFDGLAIELARRVGADVILRGVRSAKDFEYEYDMAALNRRISGIETLLMPADPALAIVSSSAVRELERFGFDASQFLPDARP